MVKLLYEQEEEEELEKCIELYKGVNPEWDSSHEYKSAKTTGAIGPPRAVIHWDEG